MTALESFKQQYFGPIGHSVGHYNAWYARCEADGAGMDLFSPTERVEAEDELLEALLCPADVRPLWGLGRLQSRAALPALHEFLTVSGAHSWSVHALRAISAIDRTALDQEKLAHALCIVETHDNPLGDPFIDLLIGIGQHLALADLGPLVINQVYRLLHHEKGLVRLQALQALRQVYALPTAPTETVQDIERSSADPFFQLIIPDEQPNNYREAERLLRLSTQDAFGSGLA